MKTKRSLLTIAAIAWVAGLLLTAVVPYISSSQQSTVHADDTPPSFSWGNNQTILGSDGSNWLDGAVGDKTRVYLRQGQKLNCPNSLSTVYDWEKGGFMSRTDFIDVKDWSEGKAPTEAAIYWFTPGTTRGSTNCEEHHAMIKINSPDNYFLTYTWINKNTITHFQSKVGTGDALTANYYESATYVQSNDGPNKGLFLDSAGGSCASYIEPFAGDKSRATLHIKSGDYADCKVDLYTISIKIAYADSNSNLDPGAGGGNTPGGTGGSAAPEKSCETRNAFDGLGWVMCAVLRMLDGAITWFDDHIQDLLVIKMSYFNDEKFIQAWGTIRNIALLILVPIMLLMVIATALEIGPFDAYTVKKALPRFLVAVLFIVLSLPLLKFLIQLSNVVETGVLGLITSAFGTDAQNITLASLFNSDASDTAVGGMGVFLALAGGVYAFMTGAVTVGIIGSFALVAFIGLLIGYVVLLIRVLLVVALVLAAPLAILPWIFPGNDKLWGIWKNTLTTLLLLGPILGALIGAGRILAKITPDDQWYFKIFFYIVVYFLILTTIKSFGGLAGTILNWGNGQARGFFDNQRKRRANSRERTMQAAREGHRFKGGTDTNLTGRVNRRAGTAANIGAIGSGGIGGLRNWRSNIRAAQDAHSLSEMERNLKENRDYATWSGDDEINRAANESHDAASLRAALQMADARRLAADPNAKARFANPADVDRVVARVESVRRQMSTPAFRQMTALQAIAGGTAFGSADEAWEAVARSTINDDSATANLVAKGRSAAMAAGKVDWGGAGFGTTLGVVTDMQAELRKTGTVSKTTRNKVNRDLHKDIIEGQGGATLVHSSMKISAVKEMAPDMVLWVEESLAKANEGDPAKAREFIQKMGSVAATQDGLNGSSPAKARIWADSVMSHKIDVASLSPELRAKLAPAIITKNEHGGEIHAREITYLDAVEALRVDPEFQEVHREYSNRIAATVAQQSQLMIPGQPPAAIPPVPGTKP